MNKLALSVDTRNRGMPVAHPASYNNYYSAGVTGEEIPEGARFMEITILGDDPAWVAFGSAGVAVIPPGGDIADGTAPLGLVGGLIFEIPLNVSHFALACVDPVVVGFYS